MGIIIFMADWLLKGKRDALSFILFLTLTQSRMVGLSVVLKWSMRRKVKV